MDWVVDRVKPTSEDITHIAENMREIDKMEIYEMTGMDPLMGLAASVKTSHRVVAARLNGEPCVIYGIARANILSDHGVPWLLSTEVATKNTKILMQVTREVLPALTAGYNTLTNFIHEDNVRSIVWLKRLGFTVEEPQKIGLSGTNFRLFHKGLK